jgi:hypothetical protein
LEWARIGSNSPSVQNFWYDDFNVQASPVPEPAAMSVIGVAIAGLFMRRRRG